MLDKENAAARKGVFMIDASKGFIKDGNKNRLREQDIHKIVDIFNKQTMTPRYARMVPVEEISDPKNDYNLNLPRYIDSTSPEDLQDIDGHLRGGIPSRDIDELAAFWQVIPGVRTTLFAAADRPGYVRLQLPIAEVKPAIFSHPEFTAFNDGASRLFAQWKNVNIPLLKGFAKDGHPKALIATIAEDLLATFREAPLLDAYDLYQHLMDCWAETMQDDCYLIAADGWVARTARILEADKKGKTKDKGWACDLVPKPLIVARYFPGEQGEIDKLQAELDAATASMAELAEEHGGEEGYLGALDKINKAEVAARYKEVGGDKEAKDEAAVLEEWLHRNCEEADCKKAIKEAEAVLDRMAYGKYPTLSEDEIKTLVVDDKWLAVLAAAVQGELDRVSQTLTGRIRQLAERYETPLPQLVDEVALLAAKVDGHLRKIGFKR